MVDGAADGRAAGKSLGCFGRSFLALVARRLLNRLSRLKIGIFGR